MRSWTLALTVAAWAATGCLNSAPPDPLADPEFQKALMDFAALGEADRFALAVHFEDVFCSARLDTISDSGPLMRLYVGGTRVRTAVLGVACTGGVDDNATAVYAQPIEVDCTTGAAAGTARLDPGKTPEGMQTATGPVTGWSIQRGAEALNCGASSCKKVFWNVALALDDNAKTCTVMTKFAASGTDANATGLSVVEPGLDGNGTCFDADGDGDCTDAGEQSEGVNGFGTCIDAVGADGCNDVGDTKLVETYFRTPPDTIYPVIEFNGQVKDGSGWKDVQYAFATTQVNLNTSWAQVSFCAKLDVNATIATTPLCNDPLPFP
jgi:hypothetical protein